MEAERWGRKIRAFRKLKAHTQESLARELNVSVSVLGGIERGTRFPSEEMLHDIADILNVSVGDLTPREDEGKE